MFDILKLGEIFCDMENHEIEEKLNKMNKSLIIIHGSSNASRIIVKNAERLARSFYEAKENIIEIESSQIDDNWKNQKLFSKEFVVATVDFTEDKNICDILFKKFNITETSLPLSIIDTIDSFKTINGIVKVNEFKDIINSLNVPIKWFSI